MDVHFQVEEYLQQLKHTLTTHHMKGHQTGPNLNWEAKLNNRADKLATEAQKQLTTIQKQEQQRSIQRAMHMSKSMAKS
eukprot:5715607-Ditylum_brightwellii.AAC.1